MTCIMYEALMAGFKLVNEQAFGTIDTWRRLRHANIVGVREAFTTKAFNDNCELVYIPVSADDSFDRGI